MSQQEFSEQPFPAAAEETTPQPQAEAQPQQQPAEDPQSSPAALPQGLLDRAVEETMKNDSVLRSAMANVRVREAEFTFDQRLAKAFASSGCYMEMKGKSITESIGIAITKIMLGKSMNMSAAEAMQAIDVIRGRLAVSAQAQAARMKAAGYDWVIEQLDDTGCVLLPMKDGKHILQVKRVDGKPIYSADNKPVMELAKVGFQMTDAKRAKLVKPDGAYETYPSDMFFARAVSRMRRRYAPETLNGADIYTTEELREGADFDAPRKPLIPVGGPAITAKLEGNGK